MDLFFFSYLQEKMNLSPRVAAAYKEVSNYQDLLLLGDLATITQEKRPYSWVMVARSPSPRRSVPTPGSAAPPPSPLRLRLP